MKACAWTSFIGGSLCLAFFGCSAGTDGGGPGPNGSGGSNGTGASSSSGGTLTIGGSVNSAGTVSLGGDQANGGSGGQACQTGGAVFVPKVPTVMLMVDRSGTMFVQPGENPWTTLRDGVLPVVQSLSADVRFGFLAITGEVGAQQCSPLLIDEIAPAENNYDAIQAKYMSLTRPLKGESPGMLGLERAAEILAADPTEGDKYILFVTDGEQDYCNDGDFACPTDSMVYHLQNVAARGIKTFVFGLPVQSTDANVTARYPLVLQAFADAGAGLTVAPVLPPSGTEPINIFYNCQGVPPWLAEWQTAMRPAMTPLGTYAAASGGAKVYRPDPTDKDALTAEFESALAGVKSCTFDIGGEIKVIQNLLSLAHVYVQGVEVPLDLTAANGWHMPTPTQIELVGPACDNWRRPENIEITWDFPCRILEPK